MRLRLRRAELHTLVGAYALDAVAGQDRARFERHLTRCRDCASELSELREATSRLAGAVTADPPARVIKRALESAASTRQFLPASGAGPAVPAWRPGQARRAVRRPAAGGAWTILRRRLALALAAMLVAAAAGYGSFGFRAEHRLGAAALRDHQIAEVLTAPDAVMKSARVTAGGVATIVVSVKDRALVFTTAGLPPLAGNRCYQLWLMGPAGDRPVGMLPPPRGGMTSPVIAAGLAAGDWIGLTTEPEGGSPRPTTTPIVMVSLTA